MLSQESKTEKRLCKWCEHPDRKVNVQGFCCQLCYRSWLGDKQEKSWHQHIIQRRLERNINARS